VLAVGIWLGVVGACDLLRAARDATSTLRRALIAAVGVLALAFAGVVVELTGGEWVWLFGGWVVCFLLWLGGSSAALQQHHAPARVVAFAGLVLGLSLTLLGGGAIEPGLDWPTRLQDAPIAQVSLDRLVLVGCVLLVQLATDNVMVRLVLDAVGVPATANEKKLKGGRLLGPMERVFIVGLGLGGEVTAAAIVVAAKGLLRFPELQRGADLEGPSDVTEYFLVGSFASWLSALGGVALVHLVG
jgi:hypothetical protein